ncbi:amidase [Burkholderia sp. S171]|uniref:amidase n=1 Tax=Burkholderia sp. S171 TaxID=1641860 RepID=UPI00131AE01B|nr:amidase family protein [Burkholderia sp. S171]
MSSTTKELAEVYANTDALGLAALVKQKQISPLELLEVAIDAVETLNPQLNAVTQKAYELARTEASKVPLTSVFAGVPFLLKDLATAAAGMQTTNSCRYYKKYNPVSTADNEAVRRMRAAGLVPFGFTNVPENGWALTTESVLNGPARNPWNPQLTPGGSSGGAAAAVASRMVPLAEGSDGAGSIRMPASVCGLVGLKPSRGRITVAPATDFWHGGAVFLCLSRSVRDTAAYLDAVGGALTGEPYALPLPETSFSAQALARPGKLRCAFSVSLPGGGEVDPEVAQAIRMTALQIEALGHSIEEHDLEFDVENSWRAYRHMIAVQAAVQFADAASTFGHPLTRDDVEPYTWANIEKGRSIDGMQHAKDIDTLRSAGVKIAQNVEPFDVFITPVMRRTAFPLGSACKMGVGDYEAYNAEFLPDTAFLFPFNVSGQPGISLPLHSSSAGLPIGVQLVGRLGGEGTLLQLATALEEAHSWHGRCPGIRY